MGISNISPNQQPSNMQKNIAKAESSVLLSIQGKEVAIHFKRIKKVAKGMAKMAFLLGETNDEEEYAEEVAEDVFEALKMYGKRKQKKKKNR